GPSLLPVLGQGVQAGQRIGGEERPPPLDDVAVVVVVRRLDDLHEEFLATRRLEGHTAFLRRCSSRTEARAASLFGLSDRFALPLAPTSGKRPTPAPHCHLFWATEEGPFPETVRERVTQPGIHATSISPPGPGESRRRGL